MSNNTYLISFGSKISWDRMEAFELTRLYGKLLVVKLLSYQHSFPLPTAVFSIIWTSKQLWNLPIFPNDMNGTIWTKWTTFEERYVLIFSCMQQIFSEKAAAAKYGEMRRVLLNYARNSQPVKLFSHAQRFLFLTQKGRQTQIRTVQVLYSTHLLHIS